MAPGSILEASGLDFGGSGDDFFEIFNSFFDAFSKYCLQGSLQHAPHETLESWSHLLFEEADNLPRTCRVAGHLPANFQPAYPHYVGPRTAKWVGGGGPPPGGSSIFCSLSNNLLIQKQMLLQLELLPLFLPPFLWWLQLWQQLQHHQHLCLKKKMFDPEQQSS